MGTKMENQFQIALIIQRSIGKKFQSRLLHSKDIKEGFHFATLKWHRLTCYLNWAILIGARLGNDIVSISLGAEICPGFPPPQDSPARKTQK